MSKLKQKDLIALIAKLFINSTGKDLKTLSDQMIKGTLQKTIYTIAEDVGSGNFLSQALTKHPKYFSKQFIKMIEMGEENNVLGTMLEQLPAYVENIRKLQKYIFDAVFCIAVFVVAGGILTAIMMLVVPQFKKIYADMGVALPGTTVLLINISDMVVDI